MPAKVPIDLWKKQAQTWITNRAQWIAKNVSAKENPAQSLREYIEGIIQKQAKYIKEEKPVPEELLIPGEIIISPKNIEYLRNNNLVDFIGSGETGDEIQFYWKKTERLPALELRITRRLDGRYVLTYIKEEANNEKGEFVWDKSTGDKKGTIIVSNPEEALDEIVNMDR